MNLNNSMLSNYKNSYTFSCLTGQPSKTTSTASGFITILKTQRERENWDVDYITSCTYTYNTVPYPRRRDSFWPRTTWEVAYSNKDPSSQCAVG